MIERRYPIQTVLANRKMFAGGGVVSPQQTAAPVQPSGGILSSSAPLMEAVAADAVNPAGGSTMVEAVEFNEGGAVRGFQDGGLNQYLGDWDQRNRMEEVSVPYNPGEEILQSLILQPEAVPLPRETSVEETAKSGLSPQEELERLARVAFVENAIKEREKKTAQRRNAPTVITEAGLGDDVDIDVEKARALIAKGLRQGR